MDDVRKVLEGYFWANKEVERLEARRRRLEKKEGEETKDTVKGSMKDHPYIERTITIEGKYSELIGELRYQIDQQIKEGLKARKAAEELIDSAEDPREREILRSRFIDCESWDKVGRKHYVDKRQAQRIVQNFVKKMQKK